MEQPPPPHIVMLSSPGMGHVIPLLELAKKHLHNHPNLTITFIISGEDVSHLGSQKSLISSIPRLNSVILTLENGIDVHESLEEKIIAGIIRSIPSLRRALIELLEAHPNLVLLADGFCSFTLSMVKELQIPAYIFFPSSATTLSTGFYFREHCLSHDGDFRDLPGPLEIPGFTSINYLDLPDPLHDRSTKGSQGILEMLNNYLLADGILVNSFHKLEPDAFRVFHQRRYADIPPVYGVGPLIRHDSISVSDIEEKSLKWLDSQPDKSVLYVSFGSAGTLSNSQLIELAFGLEQSRQRFLLVARKPNDGPISAAYFDRKCIEESLDFLPDGFMERTKDMGFVLLDWAPQAEILRHPAIGGFVTHCGWNSTLESIMNGVPLIAWPLFAEQKLNAVMVSEVLKVGLRVKENENGIIERGQIKFLARRLLEEDEGHCLRERMRILKNASLSAINEDGSSRGVLISIAKKWNI